MEEQARELAEKYDWLTIDGARALLYFMQAQQDLAAEFIDGSTFNAALKIKDAAEAAAKTALGR